MTNNENILANYRIDTKNEINELEKIVRKSFLKCNDLTVPLEKNNIILLFYHEIMHYFSTIIARKHILLNRQKKNFFLKKNEFLFIDDTIRFGWRKNKYLYSDSEINSKLNLKKKSINYLFKLLKFFSPRSRLIYLGDVSINNRLIIYKSILSGFLIQYVKFKKLHLEKRDLQIEILFSLIDELYKKFSLSIDFEQLKKDIHKSIEDIVSMSDDRFEKYNNNEIIIIGSPGKLKNRVLAMNGYAKHSKVIGVLHGEECGAVSSSSWQYDDRSLSQILIGYGKYGDFSFNPDPKMQSLDGRRQKYIQSNSDSIKKIYSSNDINDLNLNKRNKGLYISWKMNNTSVINADDVLDLVEYYNWQKYLLNQYSNIEIKVHPKQENYFKYDCKIIEKNLEECIKNYDYFVIDYISSTAFALIAATNKPIIYYNIGLSKFTMLGGKLIKERVISCDVNIHKNYEGFCLFNKNEDVKNNNYTKHFSLADNNKTRINALFDIL